MTSCDITYQLCFPDGSPRLAEVSLTLRQVVQIPGRAQTYIGRQQDSGIPGVGVYQFDDKTWNGAGHGVTPVVPEDV